MTNVFLTKRFPIGSSVLSQEIGWKKRLRNNLFCVGVGRKTYGFRRSVAVGYFKTPTWNHDIQT